jgi:protein TonB
MQLEAVGAMCVVVALGATFGVAASAQQRQSQEVPPVITAPSPPAPVPSPAVSWQQSLVAHLARFQRYPADARDVEGVVSVAFSIDRQGKVVSSRIVMSSGSPLLDAEALDLIKRADPFPPPPAEISDNQLSFLVPIRFTAR